jgi:ABC-2 type transport system permease protein
VLSDRRRWRDTLTMLRRDLLHARRYPAMTLSGFMVPVLVLLLFNGVLGHALAAGLGRGLAGRGYLAYLTPGVLVMAAGGVAEATAIAANTDMTEGIVARFRTMAIWAPSVLAGRVAGSVLRTALTGGAVLAVAVGLGFPLGASWLGWLGAIGMFLLLGLALSWLTVAFGLFAKSPEGANSLSLVPLFLPFVSSAFVTPAAMPAGVRGFAANQPFTPIIDTLRALLAGGPVGDHGWVAAAWCVGLAALGFGSAMRLYRRQRPKAG